MSVTRSVETTSRRTTRIVVAEPDSDTRLLYRDFLRSIGSDVVDAVDGRDAMVKALSVRPTLVITELCLPFFDGFALREVLRRDSLTKSVPSLFEYRHRTRKVRRTP
jgi:PleD family two-component response regulator